MNITTRLNTAFWMGSLGLLLLTVSSGCIGALAQVMYVIKGTEVEPPYTGLRNSRVAVVCVSDASAYGPDMLTSTIVRAVSMKLQQKGKKIRLVPNSVVENWIDQHGWNEADFVELGKGVDAEKVVAIQIGAYSIREGSTLFKGRADLTVTVYDLSDGGRIDYQMGPTEYSFPEHGRPSIQSSDRQFEAYFLANMTEHIANQFCRYDRVEAVARDAMAVDRL